MKRFCLVMICLFFLSCKNMTSKNYHIKETKADTIVSVCDKFDEKKNEFVCREKHIFYKDSIWFREKDTLICKEIHFLYDANKKLEKKSYFGHSSKVGNLLPLQEIGYHQNKKSSLVYYFQKTDSLIIQGKDTIKCSELHIAYDKNGNIKEKGCQGYVSNNDISTGMVVGTWYHYKNSRLTREVYYHNAEFGKDYIKHKIYDESGNFNEIFTNNFMLYETDSVTLTPKEIKKRVK